ncbi:2766_t:CDS:1, partial [Cetraspora pellucida]
VNILATIYSKLELFVGELAVSLKGALNIGRLKSIFPTEFVASQ